jgi:putative N6-adenine-specific DNA methylase
VQRFFVSTPPGLEGICLRELEALGFAGSVAGSGGVDTSGDLRDLATMTLALRTASRILLRLWSGAATSWERELRRVDLRPFLPAGATVEVDVVGAGAHPARFRLPIERLVAEQVPTATIVAGGAAQAPPGPREREEGPSSPAARLQVRVHRGQATLSVDASGEHLHRRGYRMETGAAPLRENLAAGILALAGWRPELALLDPMCGSGTFLIEGAFWALGKGPGMALSFAWDEWPTAPAGLGDPVRAALRATERERPPAPILGKDLRAGALGVARRNADRAGVLPFLGLERGDVADLHPPDTPPGVVVVNPPYGRRVGEPGDLTRLYRSLGPSLRRFSGWKVGVLVMDEKLGALLGLPGAARIPLRNGGLPCTLLVAELP